MLAAHHKMLRRHQIGLLAERHHVISRVTIGIRQMLPTLNVTVARRRRTRRDAQRHQLILRRHFSGGLQHFTKTVGVADKMIGGEHDHDRLWIVFTQRDRTQRNRRGRPASHRLDHKIPIGDARPLGLEQIHLLFAHDDVHILGHQQRLQTIDRALKHRTVADQRQHLLRRLLSRQRPQP